jgi:hypothetical protein
MQNPALRGRHRAPRPDRIVTLRASRSRLLLDRITAAVPERAIFALNAVAFVSLASALLILLLG